MGFGFAVLFAYFDCWFCLMLVLCCVTALYCWFPLLWVFDCCFDLLLYFGTTSVELFGLTFYFWVCFVLSLLGWFVLMCWCLWCGCLI